MSDKVIGPTHCHLGWSPVPRTFSILSPFPLEHFPPGGPPRSLRAERGTLGTKGFRGDICSGGLVESWDFVENTGAEPEALARSLAGTLGRVCSGCLLSSGNRNILGRFCSDVW